MPLFVWDLRSPPRRTPWRPPRRRPAGEAAQERGGEPEPYRSIRAALRPGGVFVNADATMHEGERLRSLTHELWADHLEAHGDTRAQAHARFAEWRGEDRYLPMAVELGLLRDAGFQAADALWRSPPVTVIVGMP